MKIEEMENIKDRINDINKDIVEIHCKLFSSLSKEELEKTKDYLIDTNNKYNSLYYEYDSYTSYIKENLERKIQLYNKKSKYCAIFAVIPCIGLCLAVCLVLKNYNKLLEAKLSKNILDEFIEEVEPKFKIIERMIERKADILNKKLTEDNNIKIYNEKVLCYLINDLINTTSEEDLQLKLNLIDDNVLKSITKMLQDRLNTDCKDIESLIDKEKSTYTKKLTYKN